MLLLPLHPNPPVCFQPLLGGLLGAFFARYKSPKLSRSEPGLNLPTPFDVVVGTKFLNVRFHGHVGVISEW